MKWITFTDLFLKRFTVYIFFLQRQKATLRFQTQSLSQGDCEDLVCSSWGVFLWCHYLLSSSRRPSHLYPQKIAIRRGFGGEGRVGRGWTTGSRLQPGLEPQKEWHDRKWCCLSEDVVGVVVLLLLLQFLLRWSLPSWREICLRHDCKWKVKEEYLGHLFVRRWNNRMFVLGQLLSTFLMLWP